MQSFVVTGGGGGIGRAIAERLADEGHVVVIELDRDACDWTDEHPVVTAAPVMPAAKP